MVIDDNVKDSAFEQDDAVYGKETKAVPSPGVNIGVDTSDSVLRNITGEGLAGSLDIPAVESFSHVAQSRDQIYSLLDTMCEDSTIAAVLETYAEDATEYNDEGKIMWVKSSNPDIVKYITFLLDSMNVDKNIYRWVYSLCKYGDLYLKLFRESDCADELFGGMERAGDKRRSLLENRENLDESVVVKAYSSSDHYVPYVEMVSNPAEMFELVKMDKTYAYIKANISPQNVRRDDLQNAYFRYTFKRRDVDLHGPKDYVHAALEDNTSRTPEEVTLFVERPGSAETGEVKEDPYVYKVKRGQSLLYNIFKVWREVSLLENSILLNRLTKSAITRMINVEVGDMPKEMIGPHLQGIKQLIEQKAAITANRSMTEYTNPGPVENNIYIPTHGGVGAISTDQIGGGDFNVGQLTDLDHFQTKLFGSLRIPKQYFGLTEDGAGFNGGQSLAIISSRYAKMIKRIQNTVIQAVTDAINLMLLDRHLDSYINQFTLQMLPPTTQEEIDRRDNLSSKVQVIGDIMNQLSEINNPVIKLKITKSLMSTVITDSEVIQLLQNQIDEMEEQGTLDDTGMGEKDLSAPENFSSDSSGIDLDSSLGLAEDEMENVEETSSSGSEDAGETLPSPEELGMDMTNSDNPEFAD